MAKKKQTVYTGLAAIEIQKWALQMAKQNPDNDPQAVKDLADAIAKAERDEAQQNRNRVSVPAMFSKPYEGVKYIGHWAEERADRYGRRDAMAVLKDALDRCVDEDMRTRHDVMAALDYLEPKAVRQWPFQQFRKALEIVNPDHRWQNTNAACNAIEKSFDQ